MTGLYSETGDDSSVDVPPESELSDSIVLPDTTATAHLADTVIKCHSRQPSSGLVDRDKSSTRSDDLSRDCGMFGCRPAAIQKFARIKVKEYANRLIMGMQISILMCFFFSSRFSFFFCQC